MDDPGQEPFKRVAIVGAGALGCYFASRLVDVGIDTTLIEIDRKRLSVIASEGLVIKDHRGQRAVRVPISTAGELPTTADLIILTTKTIHTAEAIASVAHLISVETAVLTLQNGLGNAEAIARFVATERVLIAVTDIAADLENANTIHSGGKGGLWLGAWVENPSLAERTAHLFRRAVFEVNLTDEVHVILWEKLAFNAAFNTICAVTLMPASIVGSAPGRRLALAIANEVADIAVACGVRVDKTRIVSKIDTALAVNPLHKPSMLQDRLACRGTEIEAISGAVTSVAQAHGLDAPLNNAMADLVRAIEAMSGSS
jgi:2-dehydropantoate 2-reductase